MSKRDDFKSWFVDTIKLLESEGDAGFVISIVTFPLLERYLRGKFQIPLSGNIDTRCHGWLEQEFNIPGKGLEFWSAYRNGLMHQATFNRKNRSGALLPPAFITGHDPTRVVYYKSNENRFYLNPVLFHRSITQTILSDFTAYENASEQLPEVENPSTAQPGYVATAGITMINPPPTGVK